MDKEPSSLITPHPNPNPYVPDIFAHAVSPHASLSDQEYQYQYSQISWFPASENELHQLLVNGFTLKISKDDLTSLTSSMSSQTGAKSWDNVKNKMIDQKLALKAWHQAYPNNWRMYGKDFRDNKQGEYVRCMQKIQAWGRNHSDTRIRDHFMVNKCPCTGSSQASSTAFVTRSLALKFLDEHDKFTQPVLKQYLNAINSQLEVQKTLCDYIFGENYVNNNTFKRKGKKFSVDILNFSFQSFCIIQSTISFFRASAHCSCSSKFIKKA